MQKQQGNSRNRNLHQTKNNRTRQHPIRTAGGSRFIVINFARILLMSIIKGFYSFHNVRGFLDAEFLADGSLTNIHGTGRLMGDDADVLGGEAGA